MTSEQSLHRRLEEDIAEGVRTQDTVRQRGDRLLLYEKMESVKIDVSHMSAKQAAKAIAKSCSGTEGMKRKGHRAARDQEEKLEKNREDLAWEEVRTEHIIQNEWIDFRQSAYRFPDGTVFEPYYSYSRRDYVVIAASDTEGNFLCVRQFRQGIKEVTTEFPAGGLERTDGRTYGPGARSSAAEDALEAAKRELLEETGYESDEWSHLLTVPSNATIADNYAFVYMAENCRKVAGQSLDETEFLNVEVHTPQEIEELIHTGKFQQCVHVMAWLLVKEKMRDYEK